MRRPRDPGVGTGPACGAVVHKGEWSSDPAGAMLVQIAAWRALRGGYVRLRELLAAVGIDPVECTLPFGFWRAPTGEKGASKNSVIEPAAA